MNNKDERKYLMLALFHSQIIFMHIVHTHTPHIHTTPSISDTPTYIDLKQSKFVPPREYFINVPDAMSGLVCVCDVRMQVEPLYTFIHLN